MSQADWDRMVEASEQAKRELGENAPALTLMERSAELLGFELRAKNERGKGRRSFSNDQWREGVRVDEDEDGYTIGIQMGIPRFRAAVCIENDDDPPEKFSVATEGAECSKSKAKKAAARLMLIEHFGAVEDHRGNRALP